MKDKVVAQGSNDRATLCDKYTVQGNWGKINDNIISYMSRIVNKKMQAQFWQKITLFRVRAQTTYV